MFENKRKVLNIETRAVDLPVPVNKKARVLRFYLGAAINDQPYYDDTKTLMKVLDKLHIPYHFDLDGGRHAWRVWQARLYCALLWIQLGRAEPGTNGGRTSDELSKGGRRHLCAQDFRRSWLSQSHE